MNPLVTEIEILPVPRTDKTLPPIFVEHHSLRLLSEEDLLGVLFQAATIKRFCGKQLREGKKIAVREIPCIGIAAAIGSKACGFFGFKSQTPYFI